MKFAMTRKFDRHTAAFDWERAMNARTFAEFDDAVTAPLHGFSGKQDYYDRCSSVHYLRGIETPTLIINALDDPFMTPDVIPSRRPAFRPRDARSGRVTAGTSALSMAARRGARRSTCPAVSWNFSNRTQPSPGL